MRAGAAALALAWAAAGRPATVEVSPRGDARRLRDKSVADPSVPGRVRTSAVAVGANLSGCAFVGEVNLGATMDMDVVSDALNHGALAAEAYRARGEANRPRRPDEQLLIISALGQILTELELSNVTLVFDEPGGLGRGWDDVDAPARRWGVVATKLTTEELVADVTVVDASHLLVVVARPDSRRGEMDALDAGRLAPQAQLFVSCLDGLFAKEIVRGFAGQTERSYEVDAWHDRVEAVDGLTGESAGTLLDRLGTSYDLDWDPLSSETAVYAFAALSATLQALEGSLASVDADDLNARLLAWLADQPAVATALGNLTFDASGQASVARAPVSQYTAEAEKKLVWYYGAAESAYLTWDQAECVYSHNCSNAGDCQGDGTCACRDGFSGDECAVKNCAPGSYYTAPSAAGRGRRPA
ncbi:hypothetical protein JL721_12842 [Aureococcus anophagefferens]|nr:hypothetical protein JL721_12842 [Aureococcus anophagefferens]